MANFGHCSRLGPCHGPTKSPDKRDLGGPQMRVYWRGSTVGILLVGGDSGLANKSSHSCEPEICRKERALYPNSGSLYGVRELRRKAMVVVIT
ncbi:hypothetical protein CsSME_00018404 [Camellia sinensis var. sinensis]